LRLAQQDYEGARQAFTEALERSPDIFNQNHYFLTEAMIGIGNAYLGLSQPQNSIHWLLQARDHGGAKSLTLIEQVRMRVSLAHALEQVGQHEQAVHEALAAKQIFGTCPAGYEYKKDRADLDVWIATHQRSVQAKESNP